LHDIWAGLGSKSSGGAGVGQRASGGGPIEKPMLNQPADVVRDRVEHIRAILRLCI
jgi:hypothetical protein